MPQLTSAGARSCVVLHEVRTNKKRTSEKNLEETRLGEGRVGNQSQLPRITDTSRQLSLRMDPDNNLPYQDKVKRFYDKKSVQILVAVLIILNFIISAVEAQLLPNEDEDDEAIVAFKACEYFFAYVFLVELAVNLYGSFFFEFLWSLWNIFDLLIVVISLLSLYMENLPGISVLRLFRAFRVVRLFKRIKTMRKMMDSIMRSLPGMSIAFAALFLIMGIYGIIGVDFWHDTYTDYFGNFLRAVLTLLQIMTFDSWCSGIAREIIFEQGAVAAVFFITYLFVSSIVMANVLIALLLDEFMNADDEEPENFDLNELIQTKQKELLDILSKLPDEAAHRREIGNRILGFLKLTADGQLVGDQHMQKDSRMLRDTPKFGNNLDHVDKHVCEQCTGGRDDSVNVGDLCNIRNATPERKKPSSERKKSDKLITRKRGHHTSISSVRRGIDSTTESDLYSNTTSDNERPVDGEYRIESEGRIVKDGLTAKQYHIMQRMSKIDQDIRILAQSLKYLCTKLDRLPPGESISNLDQTICDNCSITLRHQHNDSVILLGSNGKAVGQLPESLHLCRDS